MPIMKDGLDLHPKAVEESESVIDVMAHAKEVKAQYKELERGYLKGRYRFIGGALACYRHFLNDHAAQEALLSQDNIARLREKPALEKTSRLLLYFLTDARSEPERNIAGKYACIVDFLDEQGVENDGAAEYIEEAGGIEELLKLVRKGEALETTADETRYDDQDFENRKEFEEAGTFTSASTSDELFDPEKDLSIRLKRETLLQVLGPEIPMNRSFSLECRKTAPIGRGGIRIVGKLVDPESR